MMTSMLGWIAEWMVFVGVMALGQFSPGPDMLLITRTALAAGWKSGCWTAIGIVCGLAFHAAVAVTGVASVLSKGGRFVIAVKWVAAIYLIWLAFQLIQSGLKSERLNVGAPVKPVEVGWGVHWRRGLLCNLLNLKVAVFLAGVTAPFLSLQSSPGGWPGLLWATIVLEGLMLWCLWVFLLQAPAIRGLYVKMAHWIDLAFGFVLLGVAIALVVLD
ncbi:MAG: LysE family translocator [Verrucomicrobiae bacterium]|nr:LysE family translocator [Verrucomicrobiae bacterium]NNJ42103.1 LysE family transporter [Akkermansiaceae bacterium]